MNPLATFTAGHVTVSVFGNKKAETVIYIPIPVTEVMETAHLTEEFSLLLAFIDGMDWNRDLSPWPAPKVFRQEEDFSGKADDFLKLLEETVFPKVEGLLENPVKKRILAGISMSGLFALYGGTKSDDFDALASISGALWYDDFTGYLETHPLSDTVRRVYLSLGNREKKTKNPRMARVETTTLAIRELFAKRGIETIYQSNQGNHFVYGAERLEEAIRFLLTGKPWKGPHSLSIL